MADCMRHTVHPRCRRCRLTPDAHCPECSACLDDGRRTCPECGTRLDAALRRVIADQTDTLYGG